MAILILLFFISEKKRIGIYKLSISIILLYYFTDSLSIYLEYIVILAQVTLIDS